ncbi:MAG: EI24 domain-containing protein [Rhodospirillaceae bacterium]
MIAALLRTLLQLSDPAIGRIIVASLLATTIGFITLAFGVSGLLTALHVTGIAWLDPVIDLLGGVAVLGLAWLLFPAVVPLISSFFLDDVVDAVERRYYPGLPRPRRQPILEIIMLSLRFLMISIGLNLLALPLYLIPGMNLIVFLGLNGYLLGRQYFEQVAYRFMEPSEMPVLRRRHRRRLLIAGVIICGMVAIPFVNLLAPVLATAFMAHIFHRLPDLS